MRTVFICIILTLLASACKKHQLDVPTYFQCNKAQNLDSAAVSVKLIGAWVWKEQRCFWTRTTTGADKTVAVRFNANNTYSVVEDNTLISQGSWKLKRLDGNFWGLDLPSYNFYLRGWILFCENEVLFHNSYIDGCDNLFKKLR